MGLRMPYVGLRAYFKSFTLKKSISFYGMYQDGLSVYGNMATNMNMKCCTFQTSRKPLCLTHRRGRSWSKILVLINLNLIPPHSDVCCLCFA